MAIGRRSVPHWQQHLGQAALISAVIGFYIMLAILLGQFVFAETPAQVVQRMVQNELAASSTTIATGDFATAILKKGKSTVGVGPLRSVMGITPAS